MILARLLLFLLTTASIGHVVRPCGDETDALGRTTTYAYDAQNRVTHITHERTSDQSVLETIQYTLSPDGRRTAAQETDPSGSTQIAWQYDDLYRLTEEKVTSSDSTLNRTTDYSYDDAGNRLSKSQTANGSTTRIAYTYDSDDRLQTETTGGVTTTYAYDANGNTTSRTSPGQTALYQYDAQNRLTQVSQGQTQATAQSLVQYTYDADGNRVKATTPSGSIVFLIDPNQPYAQALQEAETSQSGTTTTAYTWGDDLLAHTRGGQRTYYHADGLGSSRLLTDDSGSATDRYRYDAYGTITQHIGSSPANHLFAGEQLDQATGLYDLRARWMNPGVGRFVTRDRFPGRSRTPISQHAYLYANANPVTNIDPTGEETLVGLDSGVSVNASLSTTATNASGIVVNRVVGKAFESYVGTLLRSWASRNGAQVFSQVRFVGSGSYRVADYIVQLGKKFVVVEAKNSFSLGVQALERLGAQIAQYSAGSNAYALGNAVEVIVVTDEAAAALEASFIQVEAQVASGTLAGVLEGTTGLELALRALLIP